MSILSSILIVMLIGLWACVGLGIFMQCANDAKKSNKATLKLIYISPLFGPLALIGAVAIFIEFLNNKKFIDRFFNKIAEKTINWVNK